MRRRILGAILASTAWLAGCVAATRDAGDSWRGTTVVDGLHTTATTTAGSVWGGAARLIEEASIGVIEGDEAYMLGTPRSVTVVADHILVADDQIPIVRVYDWDGRHVRDLGRRGDGPGEYRLPWSVRGMPDGRVLVRDDRRKQVQVYALDGEHLETWPTQHRVLSHTQMIVTDRGDVLTFSIRSDDDRGRGGMRRIGLEGMLGELREIPSVDFEPVTVTAAGGAHALLLPSEFPQLRAQMDHAGRFLVGVGESYRFDRHADDGSVLTVVREAWDRVAIGADEAAASRARISDWARRLQEDWTWNLPPIPDHRPAFVGFAPSLSGAVWVLRPGPQQRLADCENDTVESPCWRDSFSYDLFDPEGRFLGSVAAPDGLAQYVQPYIDGDVFVAVVGDESGTSMVKRFRLERSDVVE